MNSDRLIAHFDRLAEAPGASPHLRRLILDLAVRGKLAPQNPKDEPASELVKRIQTEKARLVKEGKIESREPQPPIRPHEIPFAIPESWRLICLGDALHLVNGRAFKPSEWSKTGVPIVRIQNLNDLNAPFNYCSFPVPEKFYLKNGDLLISWSGTPGTSFGAHIWDRGHAILNQHTFRAEKFGDAFLSPFLKLAINSRLLELIGQAHGGVGLQHITKPKLERLPLTLPPLAEQRRIVAKVDELMALCNRLEAAQAERENRRDRLVTTALQRLNQPTDDDRQEDFREHTRFYLNHLPHLTTRPEHIKHLRQTILDLAIRGKLLEQDPNDEPASTSLEHALKDSGHHWKGSKNFKEDRTYGGLLLPEIPDLWCWTNWENVLAPEEGAFRRGPFGSSLTKSIFVEKGYKVYEQYCPINDDCSFARYYITPQKYSELKTFAVRAGDFLISCAGVTLGRITQVPRDFEEGVINQALLRVRMNNKIITDAYFVRLFRSPLFQKMIRDNSIGMAIPNLKGVKELKAIRIPLPPIAEQHRIVAKVDELMAICDRLEAQLTTTQAESRRLLEAVLHEALMPAAVRAKVGP